LHRALNYAAQREHYSRMATRPYPLCATNHAPPKNRPRRPLAEGWRLF